MNLPNQLTMLRILLVPVFMWLAGRGEMLAAGLVFAAASITDFFDGMIARKYHLTTDFGKFADPLADKLLTTSAFVYMVVDGVCSPVVLVMILAREFAVSGLRMIAAGAAEGKVIAANSWGKVKTVLQMLTIIFYYIGYAVEQGLGQQSVPASMYQTQLITWFLCWLSAAATLVSGAKYLWDNRIFINKAK